MTFAKMYGGVRDEDRERASNDYYPTPPWATYALIEREKTHIDKHMATVGSYVWEPAAGRGWMARELARHYPVIATDLFPREDAFFCTSEPVDFLGADPAEFASGAPAAIITNPPYARNMAEAFAERAVETSPYVAMLCRLTWAESKKRFDFFRKHPPSVVLVFSQRFSCDERFFDDSKSEGGMVAYAWWVWDRNRPGESKIGWVEPGGLERWKSSA